MGLVVFGLRQMGFWDWFGGMSWFRWVYLGSVGLVRRVGLGWVCFLFGLVGSGLTCGWRPV